MKKFSYALLDMAVNALVWAAWYGIFTLLLPRIYKVGWIGLFLLSFMGLGVSSFFDKILSVSGAWCMAKQGMSWKAGFWQWLPSLTLGLYVIAMPLMVGLMVVRGYGSDSISVAQWLALCVFTLLPLLNLIGVLRTPFVVRRKMDSPFSPSTLDY